MSDEHGAVLGLLQTDRLGEAERRLLELIRRAPKDAALWNTLGSVLVGAGEAEAAVNAFLRAQALGAQAWAGTNLLYAVHTIPGVDAASAYRCIADWATRLTADIRPEPPPARAPGRPLRVGYLCTLDLGSSLALLRAVFPHHDPAAVTVLIYANDAVPDAYDREFPGRFAAIRPIHRLDDEAAAAVIRADRLDLLVDLCGHAQRQRLRLLARRVAPVQATWVESFFSTGIPAIDYFLTDAWHTPPGGAQRFSETPFLLPRPRLCYTPPPYAPAVADLPARRNGHVTFGSFNHLSKLNRAVTASWAAILRAVPDSRLVLKWRSLEDAATRDRILARFATAGIAAERLCLRGHSPHRDMLLEYGDIDIALDPFPYNGGLTTCEALWMGVPVLCLRGEQIISRQSAALSAAAGLGGFIAADEAEYLRLAVMWSRNLDGLADIRAGLRERMRQSLLCDGIGFTRDLEAAYRLMCA